MSPPMFRKSSNFGTIQQCSNTSEKTNASSKMPVHSKKVQNWAYVLIPLMSRGITNFGGECSARSLKSLILMSIVIVENPTKFWS